MNPTLRKNGIFFGTILSIFLITPSLIGYFVDVDFLLGSWQMVIIFLSSIILGVICVSFAKGKLKGIITLKECFTTYIIMIVLALLIRASFDFIAFNVLDTDFVITMKQRNIELTEQYKTKIVKNDILTDKDKEEMIKNADNTIRLTKEMNPYGVSSLLSATIRFIAILSIFGLLIGLILKTPKQN